jgi:hypothetical protein
MKLKKGEFLVCLLFIALFPSCASAAATFSLTPAIGSYVMGNNFPVSVVIDTGGDTINAAEAGLTFDNTKLSVSSVGTSGSIFSIWVAYPSFSNSAGTIHFSGGVPATGFSGTGTIFTINFKGTAVGSGDVSFAPGGKVLLNDGSGTNILGVVNTGGTYDILPVPPSVSCSASPSSTSINTPVTFSADASGGDGSYTYSWSNACTGSSSTCTRSFTTTGTKTAAVTVTSNSLTSSPASCSASISFPGLSASCSSSADSAGIDSPVTFTAQASGGSGSYAYSWSNACTGSSSTCTNSYGTGGLRKATVTVTSGGLTSSADCLVFVSPSCIAQHKECSGMQCIQASGAGIDQCSSNNDCQAPKHNECNAQSQCVLVDGAGANLCQTNNDCVSAPPVTLCGNGTCDASEDCNSCPQDCGQCAVNPVIKVIQNTVGESTKAVVENTQAAAKEVKKIVETPEGSVTTKTISTVGVVSGAVAATSAMVFNPASVFELFLIPMRLMGLLLAGLGLKKKTSPWGVVYDSVTKQPLDPAYVVLKDLQGKEISSVITDLDGRFGFLVEPGVYQISARKTNYVFPSQKLTGKERDELHSGLYFGENIIVKTSGETIFKNIPLDPAKFDWNEFSKKNKNLMKFYSKWDIMLRKIYDFFFYAGFVVAIIAYISAPYPYNTVIIILYVLFLLFRIFGLKLKTYGYIVDKNTGVPLSFPIIRVVASDSNKEITSKSADRYGKYYCLVPPGKYYVKIEKKNEDGSYSLVFTSPTIDVSKKGIIKEKFKI